MVKIGAQVQDKSLVNQKRKQRKLFPHAQP